MSKKKIKMKSGHTKIVYQLTFIVEKKIINYYEIKKKNNQAKNKYNKN